MDWGIQFSQEAKLPAPAVMSEWLLKFSLYQAWSVYCPPSGAGPLCKMSALWLYLFIIGLSRGMSFLKVAQTHGVCQRLQETQSRACEMELEVAPKTQNTQSGSAGRLHTGQPGGVGSTPSSLPPPAQGAPVSQCSATGNCLHLTLSLWTAPQLTSQVVLSGSK